MEQMSLWVMILNAHRRIGPSTLDGKISDGLNAWIIGGNQSNFGDNTLYHQAALMKLATEQGLFPLALDRVVALKSRIGSMELVFQEELNAAGYAPGGLIQKGDFAFTNPKVLGFDPKLVRWLKRIQAKLTKEMREQILYQLSTMSQKSAPK
jgi:hypothetical protein